MTTCLGKSCSVVLPRVPFVNCCQFMYLVISLLVLRAGCELCNDSWSLFVFLLYVYTFLTMKHLRSTQASRPTQTSTSKAQSSIQFWLWFILIVCVLFLFVFDLLFNLFRIALWPSFHFWCFHFSAVLIEGVSFMFGVTAGYWIRLYRFLIIAFLSTLRRVLLSVYPAWKTGRHLSVILL